MSLRTTLINRFPELHRAYAKMRSPWWRAKARYAAIFKRSVLDEKRILVESQHGKELNGIIFQIVKYLSQSEAYQTFQVIVSARGGKRAAFRQKLNLYGCDRVLLTTCSSDDYFRHLSSAKWVINDNTFLPFYMKQKGQVYLNTWHGTPLKTLGRKISNEAYAIGNAQRNFLLADYLLYPNEYTRQHMCEDYMLENLAQGKAVLAGYPRNEVFFDAALRETVRTAQALQGKRVYAYMPTFRGSARKGKLQKNDIYLNYFLYEIDQRLTDDECFYVNLLPVAKSTVDFKAFRHIRPFPKELETYAFLTTADVLVTDYSSVFFDFACTRRKVVLFTYDEEDYLRNRGLYLPLSDLPFPKAKTLGALLAELRSEKGYDDTAFLQRFCPYDGPNATQKLCDFIILGHDTGLRAQPIPSNGKKNIFLYGGNLAQNGITTSLNNLLNTVDLTKHNYVVTCEEAKVRKNQEALLKLPPGVSFFVHTGDLNLTTKGRVLRKLFKWNWLSAKRYLRLCGEDLQRELWRLYGPTPIDTYIHFNGYESENILLFSALKGKKAIFVHNDMLQEIKTRGNQRRDVLSLAYQAYDAVLPVTQDLIPSIQLIANGKTKLYLIKNIIDYHTIQAKGTLPITFDEDTTTSLPQEQLLERLRSASYRYINVGRFAPEKGHHRLVNAFTQVHQEEPEAVLVVIGGNSFQNGYNKLLAHVKALGLEEHVLLIERMSNPYPLIAACDGFVLSSFYEGFGLVLVEANILGLPVVSTDVVGPRLFMQAHGGTLVEDSEDGILHGLRLLREGKVNPMHVDYAAYNREVTHALESLLEEITASPITQSTPQHQIPLRTP